MSDQWDHLRKPYQVHIQNLSRMIDLHSEQYTLTQDQFHLRQYTRLVCAMQELKTWIKHKESEAA